MPYCADDPRRLLEKVGLSEFRPLLDWVPDLDPDVVAIAEKMIAPRADRYADMSELVRDMQRYLNRDVGAAQTPRAPPPAPAATPVAAAPRAVSGLTLGLGFAALAAAGSVAWITAPVSSPPPPPAVQQADAARPGPPQVVVVRRPLGDGREGNQTAEVIRAEEFFKFLVGDCRVDGHDLV